MNAKKNIIGMHIFDVINTLVMLLVICVIALPLCHVISISLSENINVANGSVGIFPKGFTFAAYMSIFETQKIPLAYLNSIIYTVSSVFISLVLTLITAYPLSKKFLPGRKTVLLLILFTMFFNGGLIPIYLLIQNLHMMNTVWAIIIPWAIPAYDLLLLKNYYENIPYEVYEASKIDGASEYRTLFQIYTPMSMPILATLTLFFAMTQWNNYLVPLMYLSDPSKYPLQIVLQEMLMEGQAKTSNDSVNAVALNFESLKNATIVVSVIPMLILYPFVQKYFVKGLFVGSVKG